MVQSIARQSFVRADWNKTQEHVPCFTIIDVPKFHAYPELDGTRSEAFVFVHFERGLVIIGGTSYAGEMRKPVFTILNHVFPLRQVLSMHCSANLGQRGTQRCSSASRGQGRPRFRPIRTAA